MALIMWTTENTKVSLSFSKNSFLYQWNFGSKILLANLLQTIYGNISTSIIPKIGTVSQSGFFAQASKLNSIPSNIVQATIDKASFPILSKENDDLKFKTTARLINRSIYLVLLSVFPFVALFSKELILILLGSQWAGASEYLAILSWGGLGVLIQSLYRNIVKSKALTSRILIVDTLLSNKSWLIGL